MLVFVCVCLAVRLCYFCFYALFICFGVVYYSSELFGVLLHAFVSVCVCFVIVLLLCSYLCYYVFVSVLLCY